MLDSVTAQNVFVFNVRTKRQANTHTSVEKLKRMSALYTHPNNLVLGANAMCPIVNRYDLGQSSRQQKISVTEEIKVFVSIITIILEE